MYHHCKGLLDAIEYIASNNRRNPMVGLALLSLKNLTKSPVNPMSDAKIAYCELQFYLLGVVSLKQKRGIIKSMLKRMHNKFNVSNAEVGANDSHQTAIVGITTVSNSTKHLHQTIQTVTKWIESNYPDALITDQSTEIL